MFLEDCRANSWSLRPCCMVLAYRIAHFCSVWRKKNVLNNIWAAPVLVLYRIASYFFPFIIGVIVFMACRKKIVPEKNEA